MTDERKVRAFFDALADNVEGLSDEELIAEVREAGGLPEDVAARTRSLIENAVKTFKQRRLLAARRERERSIEQIAAVKRRLPADAKVRRDWLAAMMAQPKAQGLLTAHGREFKDLTDEDVEESILELIYLGVLPPGESLEE
jgi:hypothetical protein